MFSTEESKAQGISAVKALAIASQEGQKIWTINKTNLSLALSKINLGAEAENDIRNSVNAGKISTAHETRINFNGWIGEGYTLLDPNSGGGNGGDLQLDPRNISIIGTLSLYDIITFILGLMPKMLGSISTVAFGFLSLISAIEALANGNCTGSTFETGLSIFIAIIFFVATLLPINIGVWSVRHIVFFVFNVIYSVVSL